MRSAPTENREVTGSTPVGATVPFPGFYWERDFFSPERRLSGSAFAHTLPTLLRASWGLPSAKPRPVAEETKHCKCRAEHNEEDPENQLLTRRCTSRSKQPRFEQRHFLVLSLLLLGKSYSKPNDEEAGDEQEHTKPAEHPADYFVHGQSVFAPMWLVAERHALRPRVGEPKDIFGRDRRLLEMDLI
jgi:hypothetical protein